MAAAETHDDAPCDRPSPERPPAWPPVRVEPGPPVAIVGELDYFIALEIADRLHAAFLESSRNELDLSGLEFCDGAGLRLLETLAGVSGRTAQLRLIGCNALVRTLLKVSGPRVPFRIEGGSSGRVPSTDP
jgi:anti-anti-sigma factor